eukprot:1801124-Heterocapsa_arctica.AAC.1
MEQQPLAKINTSMASCSGSAQNGRGSTSTPPMDSLAASLNKVCEACPSAPARCEAFTISSHPSLVRSLRRKPSSSMGSGRTPPNP